MINFFRKTRKKMANDNKPIKYIRYAIGEIILVVIGILIALQINNWNDNRLSQIKEKEILLTIINNCKTNIKLLNEGIERRKYDSNCCDSILTAIKYKKPIYDELPRYFHYARAIENNELSFTAYESLKSEGFNIIKNSQLRNEVMNLFEVTYPKMIDWLDKVEANNDAFANSYYLKHFESIYGGTAIPNNYDATIRDPIFKNIILSKFNIHLWAVELKNPCIKESERIINLIKEELK